MNKPHKHAELIKAWADGAEIQYHHSVHGWMNTDNNKPYWTESETYRIKPEPKPDVVKFARCVYNAAENNTKMLFPGTFASDEDNIRLTFDGETGKLKAVELLDKKG